MPGPMSLQLARCDGEESRSRGNHSSGAETDRPSARVTWRESVSTSTETALASVLTLAVDSNVVIPFVPYLLFVFLYQFSNLFELLAEKSVRLCQQNRIQPELGILLGGLNMDVKWLFRLTAEMKGSPAARHIFLAIEVGTPVSPDAPLADPGVRNYRTGLLRKRALETSSDTECQNRLPMQAGRLTRCSGSTWPDVSPLLALLPAHSFAL